MEFSLYFHIHEYKLGSREINEVCINILHICVCVNICMCNVFILRLLSHEYIKT